MSTAYSWKHHFYAFLLRRVLGPILTTQSAADLRSSIHDFDWSEGKVVLVDVELDAEYLTSLIRSTNSKNDEITQITRLENVVVHRSKIKRLGLHLSLSEVAKTNGDQPVPTSTARKATSALLRNLFGNFDENSSSIALIVHVEVDGVEIEFASSKRCSVSSELNAKASSTPDQNETSPGFFTSLVDSALKSLRLSIDIRDMNIRVLCEEVEFDDSKNTQKSHTWVGLNLASARYYDLMENIPNSAPSISVPTEKEVETLVLSKAIDWNGLVVETGQTGVTKPYRLVQTSGDGHVKFRLCEKKDLQTQMLSRIQEVDVTLGHHVAVDMNCCVLAQLVEISNWLLSKSSGNEALVDGNDCGDVNEYSTPKFALEDEFTRETYDKVMKQYTEARHLARTREIRGGMLIPSFENEGQEDDSNGEISFDAFFDANDHSISYYCDLIDENRAGENTVQRGKQHTYEISTKIDFSMPELTLMLNFGELHESRIDSLSSEYILLSMGDIQCIMFSLSGETKVNLSISYFEIESQMLDNQSTINESIVRFVDQSEGENSFELLISRPPSISLYIEFSRASKENGMLRINMVFQHLEVIYRHHVISRLADIATFINRIKEMGSKGAESSKEKTAIHLSLSCVSLILLAPCTSMTNSDSLFERCGYNCDEERLSPFLGLGLELDNISAEFLNKCDEECKTITKFGNAVIFAKRVELESVGSGKRRFQLSYVCRRTDLVACMSDQDIASDSSIIFSHSQIFQRHGIRKKSSFPVVLPLSSIKYQEDDDSDLVDSCFDDLIQNSSNKDESTPTDFTTTDPQYIMSTEANEAKYEMTLNIPYIFLDVTSDERESLICISSSILSQINQSKGRNHKNNTLCNNEWTCFAVNIGQLSLVLYGNEQTTCSYSFIFDSMRLHTSFDGLNGLRNARIASTDCTLYELITLNDMMHCKKNETPPLSGPEKCKRLQERLILKEHCSLTKAIFFRSKLGQSLCPEHPAVLFDAILRRSHDTSLLNSPSNQCEEKSVHLSLYDMTLRYCVESEWISNLITLIRGSNTIDKSGSQVENKEAIPSITNFFINFMDCNFDYTSPMTYKTASRIVFRIGDAHVSSSLLTPPVKVHAYKVSLAELGLHVCNYRHSYHEENALLSCAHRHFTQENLSVDKGDQCIIGKTILAINSTLSKMDFINALVVDSVDAAILLDTNQTSTKPATTVALTLGTINCNFCQDSFACLSDTLNEGLVRFTSLSEEELENLRCLSESKSQVGVDNDIELTNGVTNIKNECTGTASASKPVFSAEEIARDSATIDLTNTLLFQDYYTIEARNRPSIAQGEHIMHQVNTVIESTSSDDEWAAVEHEYLRHSSIPAEDEQKAEWIIYDKEVAPGVQSQAIKVFPQHFSARPCVDPLCGEFNSVGTNVPAQVSLRLVVKCASVVSHFFDGLDWAPQLPDKKVRNHPSDRRKILLNDLLDDQSQTPTFIPLPDERSEIIKRKCTQKRLRRKDQRYFSISIGGLMLSQDTYVKSAEHQLTSCLEFFVADFFVAETIRNKDPVKMIGEWVNEDEHPRDASDGVIMLKMVTNHPKLRVSADGNLMSDESKATLELLPLRCFFYQTTIRFISCFFCREDADVDGTVDDANDRKDELELPPMFFTSFKVAPAKLKVDYIPEKMDVSSFREGNYVEILNLCPLEDMVLTLQAVENNNLLGWGSIFGELASRWIDDVGSTQSHKFFTRATPMQFFSGVTEGVADLAMVLVVPESGNFTEYLKDVIYSSTSFASKLVCETLTTSAKLTRYAANQLNTKDLLPRPKTVPRHVGDAAGHSVESISRGLRQANYKIITVPLREYQQSGASGAAKSAVKGLPIAVLAPLSGASEALSYTLLGLRNSLRPDLRKEAEASLRGLNFE